MVKLVLLVSAVTIFGVGFITMILNQMSTASHIILDMYHSSDLLVHWVSKIAIIFSHPFMLALSSIYIIYFIISKTIYS
ncbi:hypothetical protein [Spiroplasma endosymbiont of Colias croceus]|uniref:hypothetical protein n=1 Tax=Spiroplasma endosymbiont of Colias croceus TaxID=3066310 RepID=UPI0030CFA4FF